MEKEKIDRVIELNKKISNTERLLVWIFGGFKDFNKKKEKTNQKPIIYQKIFFYNSSVLSEEDFNSIIEKREQAAKGGYNVIMHDFAATKQPYIITVETDEY